MTTATATKERPILFSGPMVRAILDGRKTQTRRALKPQPSASFLSRGVVDVVPQWPHQDGVRWFMSDGMSELVRSPYCKPGDRLWVRESFDYIAGKKLKLQGGEVASRRIEQIRYRADGGNPVSCNWTPSIHMPRWASRITLEVTGVRVERLNEISESDCWSEGIEQVDGCFDSEIVPMAKRLGLSYEDAKPTFACLWESINGAASWDANPWVWVIEFKPTALM